VKCHMCVRATAGAAHACSVTDQLGRRTLPPPPSPRWSTNGSKLVGVWEAAAVEEEMWTQSRGPAGQPVGRYSVTAKAIPDAAGGTTRSRDAVAGRRRDPVRESRHARRSIRAASAAQPGCAPMLPGWEAAIASTGELTQITYVYVPRWSWRMTHSREPHRKRGDYFFPRCAP